MNDNQKKQINEIDLKENNIFLVRALKNLSNFIIDVREKEKLNKENLEFIEENLEWENKKDNNIKEEIKEIFITIKKIKTITKISINQFNLIEDTIKLFLTEKWNKLIVNEIALAEYLKNTDTVKIENDFLNNTKKEDDWEDINILSFPEKVQKLFTNVEKLTDENSIVKQMISDTLDNDCDYSDLVQEKEELLSKIKERKETLLEDSPLQKKADELKDELKEEKSILNDFLEVSVENWDYKTLQVNNKDWKKMKPKVKVSFKEIKEQVNN